MQYTTEEKRKMDALAAAFSEYIRGQDYFDILWSDKIGYFRIVVREGGEEYVTRLGSFDEMLETLIDDMLMEEAEKLSACGDGPDYSRVDLDAVRGRLVDIFSGLEDAGHCKEIMERQMTEWMAEYPKD